MKKIKFLGTAILAASLLLAGCSSPVDDVVNDDDTPVTLSPEDDGNTNGGGTTTGGTTTGGTTTGGGSTSGGSNEPVINYTAPDLTGYYKNYFVSTTETAVLPGFDIWGSGTNRTINDDHSWTITPGSEWGAGTSCIAFTNITAGSIANYEYIVFTIDTTNFSIRYGDGNNGINVKVPEEQRDISTNCVVDGNLRTYYAPVSLFGTAPENAVEFAIIISGTGTYKVNEVYFASADDPNNRAVTDITITPSAASIAQGGTQQFTVKDSNHTVLTSGVTYSLSGVAATGSTITAAGLLTAGSTEGSLTVTATYTVDGEEFTAAATITVLGQLNNLITNASITTQFYNPGWSGDQELDVTEESGKYTIVIPTGCSDRWQAQFGLTTDASIVADDDWYFSFKVKAEEDTGTAVIKFNNAATLLDQTFSVTAGEEKTVSFSGSCSEGEYNNIVVFFDFGLSGVNEIEISDIVLAKTN